MIEVKIEEPNNEEKDIFQRGNLVRYENKIVLVINDSPVHSVTFEGISLNDDRLDFAEYSEDWIKHEFSQFTGSITLTYKP